MRFVASKLYIIVMFAFSILSGNLFMDSMMASDLPAEPVLRIATEMHTARINRIDTDAAEKLLITASDDKTVRVWDLQNGRLQKILRVPADTGDDGRLYAAAISPDGHFVVAGGWTEGDLPKTACVYIFDLNSGTIVKRIIGLPNAINHLAFSQDGKYLAVALGGKNGVRIYTARTFRLKAEDKKYGNDCYWAAFSPNGRLATVSYDGFVRLYDRNFRLVEKVIASGGHEPFSVAFAPDGEKIAVGFNNSAKISILSGRNLSFLYAPDVRGINNGDISSVAWSADGNLLSAGGSYDDGTGMNPIRRWEQAGRGTFKDMPASGNTLMHILPLKNGETVFAASDPSWGVLNRQGQKRLFVSGVAPDYRNIAQGGLLVSLNGGRVSFGASQWGERQAVFDLASRTLTLSEGKMSAMRPPLTQAPGIAVTQWQGTYSPKLNGQKLLLERNEMAVSLAIAPDRQSFLLGTNYSVRRFDRNGNLKWNIPTGEVWGVNVAGNGKTGVAALGDGTVRWYDMQDGNELMALFPHKDGKRWIVWTPSGYYAASAGGENLIGWHVNRGRRKTPDFFPAARFRAHYYRPDIIARVLHTGDEKEAVHLANTKSGRSRTAAKLTAMYPPVVRIISPRDGIAITDTNITLRYSTRTPSGAPVINIKIKIDGRPLGVTRGIKRKKKADAGAIQITAPQRDCEIALIAENRHAASVPATIRLVWQGAAESSVIKPKLYVLAMGVSDYVKPELHLAYPVKDARDTVKALIRQKDGLYRDVVVKLLTDPDKGSVLDGLEWIKREVTAKDVAMIFLAGHGVNDSNGDYRFLPADVDPQKLKRTGVPYHIIRDTIADLPGKALLFADTCHSGNIMGGQRNGDMADMDKIAADLSAAENGVVIFASSTGRQYSIENDRWRNGAFTKALVEGLTGRADYTKDNKITITELDLYLSERVKALTKGAQTPTTSKPKTIQDFPIAIIKR